MHLLRNIKASFVYLARFLYICTAKYVRLVWRANYLSAVFCIRVYFFRKNNPIK